MITNQNIDIVFSKNMFALYYNFFFFSRGLVTSGGWWSCYNTLWSELFIQGFLVLHHCNLYMISTHFSY